MKFAETFVIDTSRCRLRYVSLDDIPHIWSATRHVGFNDGMLWDPPVDQKDLIGPYHSNVKAWKEDQAYSFTIEDKEENQFIGRVSIHAKEGSIWDLGFWTHPDKQNRGYMTEAVIALVINPRS